MIHLMLSVFTELAESGVQLQQEFLLQPVDDRLDRLAVGENTGSVVPSLKEIAKTYQKSLFDYLA